MKRFQKYHPTKTNKGSAMSLNAVTEESAAGIWLEIIMQNGWNSERGNGIFKDGKKASVKMNWEEISLLKRKIEKNEEHAFIHDFEGKKTVIPLKRKYDQDKKQNGLSIQIKKDGESFYFGFSFEEIPPLIDWLGSAIDFILKSN
jgi:hypothetical protein